ncbi:DNA packaging protein [Stenotrophomonas sp. PS02298]|uniref:DNA packaging protein n=1 Tax=Stenotrophomonas sp. PS02298 TaxID=2991424 RepID=UPI002499D56B|nr:DNA packaging protein [Stenotrophomonas sp. PS02298]
MTELTDQEASRFLEKLSDRWWRLNNLYYITDKYGRKVLFKVNEVQADLDDNLHTLNLVLKSRQHGITTLACIRALDMALFKKNTQAGVVAHTAGDAAKFFRKKVLYAYDNLPDWLKAVRPAVRRDMRDGVLELANGSSIEVSVSHRGGTLTFLHISEYGPLCAQRPEAAQEVSSGALNAIAPGNIVIIESTAYGASGDFYDRCQTAMELDRQVRAGTAKLTVMDYKFHFYPWFRDPINELDPEGVQLGAEDELYFAKVEAEMNYKLSDRQKAWYVKKAGDQRDKMKREHPSTPEEAFEASTEGAYYGKEMAAATNEGRITSLPINPAVPIHTFWDIGRSDTTVIWFMQENGPWLDFVDYYENSGFGVSHYAKVLKERGYLYGKHYWPHDGANEDWSANENRVQVANKLGIKPIIVVPRIDDITEGIDMVRNMLPRCRFDKTRCGPPKAGNGRGGLEGLRRYHKAWNEKTETFSDMPKHDWASNPADGFRQAAQGYVSSTGRRVGESRALNNDNWRTA